MKLGSISPGGTLMVLRSRITIGMAGPDLLVMGYGKIVALFHNEPDGKVGRKFRDATVELGLRDSLWSTSCCLGRSQDGERFSPISTSAG